MASYKELGLAYLRQVEEATGKSPSALAKIAGVSPSTFTRPLNNGDHKYAIKFQALRDLAEKVNIPLPAALLEARDAGTSAAGELDLPIRYEVAASGFIERDSAPQEPFGYRRVQSIPPYTNEPQWLERVVNDSMDRLLPPGTLLHVVDAIAIGYQPRQNAVVVVERSRMQGSLIERTVKQVELGPFGVSLWPRSHNPRWSQPINLTAGVAANEDDPEVQIVGLVLRAYSHFHDD